MKIKLIILTLLILMLGDCKKQQTTPISNCLDFQSITSFPQTFPGPTFTVATVPNNPLGFTNPIEPAGNYTPITLDDRDNDGNPELYVGVSKDRGGYLPLYVEFPPADFPYGVQDVAVELMTGASDTVMELDNWGNVISTASQPTHNIRTTLPLSGQNIRKLQFNMVETMVYKICWIPSPPPTVCSVCVDLVATNGRDTIRCSSRT